MSDHPRADMADQPEALRLLSSNAVEGMAVFGRDGDKVGTVAAVLFDRFTGQADFIVVLIGRVLGIGGNYHPLPWPAVHYEPRLEGYVLGIERTMLSSGPSFKSQADVVFDSAYSDRILSYYRMPAARQT